MKKFISFFICAVLVMLTVTSAFAAGDVEIAAVWYREGDYYYTVENGEAAIESFYGEVNGVVDIPDELGGYPVVRIEDYVYSGERKLTGAVIPKTVRSLGSGVFYGTRYYDDRANWTGELLYADDCLVSAGTLLGKIKVKDGTRCIADGIFDYSEMTELYLPKTVENLGNNTFVFCSNLRRITVEEGSENYLSDENGILYSEDYEKLIKMPEASSVTEIILPEGTKSIEAFAFANTNLQRIVISGGLQNIGINAFEKTDIEGIKLPSGITEIPDSAFSGCKNLRYIIVEGKIDRIGYYALKECENLGYILYEGWYYGLPMDIFNGNEAFDRAEITYGYKNGFTLDVPSVEMLTYGDGLYMEITAINGLSEDSLFSWSADSEAVTLSVSEDGKSCIVKPSIKGKDIESVAVTVTSTDEDGKGSENAVYLTVDCRWYQKILSFFRMIFGLTTIIYC